MITIPIGSITKWKDEVQALDRHLEPSFVTDAEFDDFLGV